jgi:histidinol-phosphate phosphatase family protein
MKRAAIFLDRDGTLNFDSGYVSSADELELFPAARRGLQLLRDRGYLLFVVTNQSGLARGYLTRRDLAAIHRKLRRELNRDGVVLKGIAVCPHHPDARCRCRKPSPLLVEKIARRFRIDLGRSYFIGDKILDVETGRNAGCRTALIASGARLRVFKRSPSWSAPDVVAPDLQAAARLIPRAASRRRSGKAGRRKG